MTKQSSRPRPTLHPTRAQRPNSQPQPPSTPSSSSSVQTGNDLLALRTQLARAEKAARRAPTPPSAPPRSGKTAPVNPQREAELAGILTDDFSLHRAHARLREAVYDGRYTLCPHAIGHARAEGFMEHDIMNVLLSGRVRAVYPDERRWLVCGRYEACGVSLSLHVVAQHHRDGHLDIVTAFVPKHPHHIISRARLAVMLRYDDQRIQAHTSAPGSRAGQRGSGQRSRGKWRK